MLLERRALILRLGGDGLAMDRVVKHGRVGVEHSRVVRESRRSAP